MSLFNIAWQWLISAQQWHGSDSIPVRLGQHLVYTGIALGIAIVIALPAGLAMGHLRRGGFAVVTLANFGRALPTLGLLVLARWWLTPWERGRSARDRRRVFSAAFHGSRAEGSI